MSILRAITVGACFQVIHHCTMPDHHLATLVAVLLLCIVVASDVAEGSR